MTNVSAVITSPVPTELKARLYTWLLLLFVVLVSATILWLGTLLSFGLLNLFAESALGRGADETWQALFISISAGTYFVLALLTFAGLVRGTLRRG